MGWEPNWREDDEALDELDSVLIPAPEDPEREESEDEPEPGAPDDAPIRSRAQQVAAIQTRRDLA